MKDRLIRLNGQSVTADSWSASAADLPLGGFRSEPTMLFARNYLGVCDVLTVGLIVTIRLSAARALPVADNVEGADTWEDGWTTGWIQ